MAERKAQRTVRVLFFDGAGREFKADFVESSDMSGHTFIRVWRDQEEVASFSASGVVGWWWLE